MAQTILSQKSLEDKTNLGQTYSFSSVVNDLVHIRFDGHVVATMTVSDFTSYVANAQSFNQSVNPSAFTVSPTTSVTNGVQQNG